MSKKVANTTFHSCWADVLRLARLSSHFALSLMHLALDLKLPISHEARPRTSDKTFSRSFTGAEGPCKLPSSKSKCIHQLAALAAYAIGVEGALR
jgi:hypothetical protein